VISADKERRLNTAEDTAGNGPRLEASRYIALAETGKKQKLGNHAKQRLCGVARR